jgi:hypothetical protein
MGPPRALILAMALAEFAPIGAAQAGCTASPAVDACLVGTWKQTGEGPPSGCARTSRWLKSAPSRAMARSPSTFSTSKVDAKAEVGAKDAPVQPTGQMSGQASGQWSAAGGTLTLCMTDVSSKGMIELKGPNGEGVKMAMPQMKPTDASMSYTCNGEALSTVQPMPKNTTMTTTYAKLR